MKHSPTIGFLTAALLATIAGCGSSGTGLETVEVSGEVVFSDGKSYPGGRIDLRSAENTSITTVGRIMADGTFTLRTMNAEGAQSGAVPGSYQVTITPMLVGDQTEQTGQTATTSAAPVVLPELYEIKPSQSNHLTITLER